VIVPVNNLPHGLDGYLECAIAPLDCDEVVIFLDDRATKGPDLALLLENHSILNISILHHHITKGPAIIYIFLWRDELPLSDFDGTVVSLLG
jgi:hypothetical protein